MAEEKQIKDIDHEYTNEIVCPHCGYEYGDSWEYLESDGDTREMECDECGEKFEAVLHLTVEYSTEKIESAAEDNAAE